MPITRTAIIDDDGSGKTGTVIDNAWKQELYNQIDAIEGGGAPTAWTVYSTVGVPLTTNGAKYLIQGKLVHIWVHVTFPSTADAQSAGLTGFPFANSGQFAGFYQTFGPPTTFHLPASGNMVLLLDPVSMAARPNSYYSGAQLIFQGNYLRV